MERCFFSYPVNPVDPVKVLRSALMDDLFLSIPHEVNRKVVTFSSVDGNYLIKSDQ